MTEQFDQDEDYVSPASKRRAYPMVFYDLDGDLDASPREDFYAAAAAIVGRLARRETLAEIEGLAALFLFRHYLELVLKSIVFGARSLESRDKNIPRGEVMYPGGHELLPLWIEAREKVPIKLGKGLWKQWDYPFVQRCIEDFHALDPTSERLRYRWEKKAVARDALKSVRVNWSELIGVKRHTYEVLEAIDSYLVETYGQNKDWENEMNSW